MRSPWFDLLSGRGTSGRAEFVLVGLAGFAIKFCVDHAVARRLFDERWELRYYLGRVFELALHPTSFADLRYPFAMLLLALPFVALGVSLTLRRLRDCRLPLYLIVLFFVPVLNLVLFTLLAVLPGRMRDARLPADDSGRVRRFLTRWIPESRLATACLAVAASAVLGLALAALASEVFEEYGFALFIGLPFSQAFVGVLLYGVRDQRRLTDCLVVGMLTQVVTACLLLLFALEGILCIVMAAPFAAGLAVLGASVGWIILQAYPEGCAGQSTPFAVAVFPLLLLVAEDRLQRAPPLCAVESFVVIDAPPGQVWQNVVTFPALSPPTEWLFRAGIAYPTGARLQGSGVGAIRFCEFNTGEFVEPITVWDEPHRLSFDVTAQPAPMQEWTPYREIHPPHLDGFLTVHGGEFRLVALPGGRTRLEGTTWYRHRLWPIWYWRWWTTAIIEAIHLRVLQHIQAESERGA